MNLGAEHVVALPGWNAGQLEFAARPTIDHLPSVLIELVAEYARPSLVESTLDMGSANLGTTRPKLSLEQGPMFATFDCKRGRLWCSFEGGELAAFSAVNGALLHLTWSTGITPRSVLYVPEFDQLYLHIFSTTAGCGRESLVTLLDVNTGIRRSTLICNDKIISIQTASNLMWDSLQRCVVAMGVDGEVYGILPSGHVRITSSWSCGFTGWCALYGPTSTIVMQSPTQFKSIVEGHESASRPFSAWPVAEKRNMGVQDIATSVSRAEVYVLFSNHIEVWDAATRCLIHRWDLPQTMRCLAVDEANGRLFLLRMREDSGVTTVLSVLL